MVVSTPRTAENSGADDPRRARIVEAAMQVFLAYGFSRTTMDDIARAVEISRPALYLLFRNKADIFRAVGETMLARSRAGASAVLFEEGPLDARLMAALDRALFQMFRTIEHSPHGDELIDVNHNIASDMVAGWRQGMIGCFARAIGEEAQRRGVRLEERGLSAESLAEMLFDVLEGLKARGLCGTHAEESARRFVTLIELALREK
ncbi:TetR/AcrR family transcriptional regulator [Chelativorans xinjiangense]|uniref:TetR/AcrR family transcriptional regulator n=1 Tax=Chelativorans xinjiangense TaxID=2681485 RepID=UPI0013577F67|nr:TetR/AcrR family transcriptional regulator [Chelativorans xinjiangense]